MTLRNSAKSDHGQWLGEEGNCREMMCGLLIENWIGLVEGLLCDCILNAAAHPSPIAQESQPGRAVPHSPPAFTAAVRQLTCQYS